ncbi:MAG: type IV pilus assembly protein PilM [Candidatus Hydrogenedentes bacterium]|nr:type IV pilus assembly protein PilM [Candidatus Hydrogenedentota bacterium]
MISFMTGRKKRLVLDIGSSCIRLCELSQTKQGYQLTKYYQREYSSDPALEEDERKKIRLHTLASLLKDAKVRTRKTILAVPGQSVFTRTRPLPPVPEYKVTQIVRYEIQQQIPFSLDQIAMDYQILSRTEAGGYDVMMAAIKVDVVEKHLDVLHGVKRTIDIVDVSPLAAYNWLKHTGEFGDQGECVALIDMGAATTDIVIEREGQFRFTRPLNLGGNDITLAIAAAFGMNFSDAEKAKRDQAFAPTGDPREGKSGEIMGNILQRFVGEIMRSFAYFRSLPGGGQVNRVILCGGGACLRNIIPYMQRNLGVEVRIAQPLAGLAIAPAAQAVSSNPEQACVSLGLALRCCETVPIGINLIPPRIMEMHRQREQAFYWVLSLATFALIMASIIPVSAKEDEVVQNQIKQLKQALREYDPQVGAMANPGSVPESKLKSDFSAAKSAVVGLAEKVKTLDGAREGRHFWLEELSLINDARPTTGGNVYIAKIESTFVGQVEKPGGRAGGRANRDENKPRFGGALVSNMNRGGVADLGVPSTGFPPLEDGGVGAGAGLGMLSRGSGGGGGRGGRGAKEQAGPVLQAPNGVVVMGYADSAQLIKEFVDNISKTERTLQNQYKLAVEKVHFNEAIVQKVYRDVVYDTLNTSQYIAPAGFAPNDSLFSFTLIVQFKGELYPAAAKQKPAAAGAPGMGPGGEGAEAIPDLFKRRKERAAAEAGGAGEAGGAKAGDLDG